MQGVCGRCGGAARVGTLVTLDPACVELWGSLAYSSTRQLAAQVN